MPETAVQHPIDKRLRDVAVRLELTQAMLATTIAIMLRMSTDDHRRGILEEFRRNVLLTMARIVPNADPTAVLTHEEAADGLLDEILRLSRMDQGPPSNAR